jgi:hypothetical protein
MDKATKNQFSLGCFVIGFVMLLIPYLKDLDSIPLGISQYFSIMFYIGLLLIILGYYLK